jgi:hypothetical protein
MSFRLSFDNSAILNPDEPEESLESNISELFKQD